MKTLLLACALTAIAGLPLTAVSADKNSATDTLINAAAQNEARDRAIDHALAPIKSDRDVRSYLVKNDRNSPLNLMSEGGKRRFIESLQFNEKGLTTYEYSDLRSELTASQVYQVLSLFGAQRTVSAIPGLRAITPADKAITQPKNNLLQLFPDYPDHWCESHATCSQSMRKICTSNC